MLLGSWLQVAAPIVGKKGQVFALDILSMDSRAGVSFIQGDVREQAVLYEFKKLLEDRPFDLVISDIAPNMSGNPIQLRSGKKCLFGRAGIVFGL